MGCQLLLITGLPATGKTTLARMLARQFRMSVIAKDTIKEPLLDQLGARDDRESRKLSDASFAVMFALARQQLSAGQGLILEGNFRAGEHESALLAAGADQACLAQVLCRAEHSVLIGRLQARRHDPSRHPGHRDSQLISNANALDESSPQGRFLDLPGERWVFESGMPDEEQRLIERLQREWVRSE